MPFVPNGKMRINFSTGTQVKSAYSVQAQKTIQIPQIRLLLIEPNILKLPPYLSKRAKCLVPKRSRNK